MGQSLKKCGLVSSGCKQCHPKYEPGSSIQYPVLVTVKSLPLHNQTVNTLSANDWNFIHYSCMTQLRMTEILATVIF